MITQKNQKLVDNLNILKTDILINKRDKELISKVIDCIFELSHEICELQMERCDLLHEISHLPLKE